MQTMTRETWTDERMDDLAKGVDTGFDRVDRRFERVHADIRTLQVVVAGTATREELKACLERVEERFDKVDEHFDKIDKRFERVEAVATERFEKAEVRAAERFEKLEARADARFDATTARFERLEHLLLQGSFGLIGALVVGLLGLAATQL